MSNKEKDFIPLTITNVPKKLKNDLENISQNEGATLSGFIKSHLIKIRDSYPDYMRKKNID